MSTAFAPLWAQGGTSPTKPRRKKRLHPRAGTCRAGQVREVAWLTCMTDRHRSSSLHWGCGLPGAAARGHGQSPPRWHARGFTEVRPRTVEGAVGRGGLVVLREQGLVRAEGRAGRRAGGGWRRRGLGRLGGGRRRWRGRARHGRCAQAGGTKFRGGSSEAARTQEGWLQNTLGLRRLSACRHSAALQRARLVLHACRKSHMLPC